LGQPVKEATRTRIGPYAAIALAGIREQQAADAELISGLVAEPTAGGQGTAVQYAHWARSVLMNGLCRYEQALTAPVEATEAVPELFIASWALSELVEAATRTENLHNVLSRGWPNTSRPATPTGRPASTPGRAPSCANWLVVGVSVHGPHLGEIHRGDPLLGGDPF
jgi:hypothetical protein